MQLTFKDRERLRALASRQAEIAASDSMKRLYEDWKRHGAFQRDARPMITIELWTFADEVIPPMLECETAEGRQIETRLLSNLIPYTMFHDDTPVRNYWPVNLHKSFHPYGLKVRKQTAGDSDYVGAGQHFETYLHDLEEDMEILGPSEFSFNLEETQREIETYEDLFGDILPVRRSGESLYIPVAEDIIHMIDMQTLYIELYENPDKVHELFELLTSDYMRWLDAWEEKGLLLPTAGDEHLDQGSFCFTDSLPSEGTALKAGQVWGYMDAEEFNSVSPQMYKEFIFGSYRKIIQRLGALSYGCCEALENLWEDGLDQFGNLKKVSVSMFADPNRMGEYLRGKEIVYLRKPDPGMLGVYAELDEDRVRSYFKETALAARGCRLEITQRDVYLLHNTPDKVSRYIQLVRETVEQYWRP